MTVKPICDGGPELEGKYVAFMDFNDKRVICADKDPHKVCEEAHKITDTPLVFYVPYKDSIMIGGCELRGAREIL